MSPIQSAFLGGAAVLALSAGAAFAAADTAAEAPAAKTEKRVVIVRSENGHTTTYDSAVDKGPPPMMHGPMGPGGEDMMIIRHHGDPQQMAKHLRDVLQLTPQQEPALQAFLSSMHPPGPPPGGEHHMKMEIARGPDGKIDAGKMREQAEKWRAEAEAHRAEAEKRRAEEAALTTPQRLDRMVQHMAEADRKREAEVQAHADAVKRFYGALTPTQQKAFDALHQGGMGGMMMHGGPERRVEVMRLGMAPMPPLPPMPPHAMHAPLPPAPPEPPLPPPPPPGDL